MTDAEDLELLGYLAPSARPRVPSGCPVADWIDLNGLMPGRAQSIEMSALYRMYLERNPNPVKPLFFTRRVHGLGFKTGRAVRANQWTRPLKMSGESARRMRRWLELNPQPLGWAKEFASYFWRKRETPESG